MAGKYLYLLMNIVTILFPFLFSFEKKIAFYKSWRFLFPALIITAVPFIAFDNFYTSLGVWGFNENYITGTRILYLPIEEILFFFTIPYACLFIYHGLNKLFPVSVFFEKASDVISIGMMLLCLALAIIFFDRAYTTVICFSVFVFVGVHTFILKSDYMGKFWRFFAVQLIPFLIVNGILTGTAIENSVFWYNPETIMNVRIGTIPIEDLFFALALLLMNVTLFEWFKNRSVVTNKKLVLS